MFRILPESTKFDLSKMATPARRRRRIVVRATARRIFIWMEWISNQLRKDNDFYPCPPYLCPSHFLSSAADLLLSEAGTLVQVPFNENDVFSCKTSFQHNIKENLHFLRWGCYPSHHTLRPSRTSHRWPSSWIQAMSQLKCTEVKRWWCCWKRKGFLSRRWNKLRSKHII